MKKICSVIVVSCLFGCDQQSVPARQENDKVPTNLSYSVINARNENGTQFYDIFLKDTAAISSLNGYLKVKYNKDHRTWIEINYFNDSVIAKVYFQKQFDNTVPGREKDRLFKHFIANYKFNPNTGYDSLSYEQ